VRITTTEGLLPAFDLAGQQGVRQLLDAGRARCVVNTCGSQGARAFYRLGTSETQQVNMDAPTLAQDALVDATGAGDAFAAGFLTWFAREEDQSIDLSAALMDGCAYGAACCGVVGASAALDSSRVTSYALEIERSDEPYYEWPVRPRRPPSQ